MIFSRAWEDDGDCAKASPAKPKTAHKTVVTRGAHRWIAFSDAKWGVRIWAGTFARGERTAVYFCWNCKSIMEKIFTFDIVVPGKGVLKPWAALVMRPCHVLTCAVLLSA